MRTKPPLHGFRVIMYLVIKTDGFRVIMDLVIKTEGRQLSSSSKPSSLDGISVII